MGLLWYHYRGIIPEGDGDRFVDLVPTLLRVFKTTNTKNYAKEMMIFITNSMYML